MDPVFKNKENSLHHLSDGRIIWDSRSCGSVAVVFAIYRDNIFVLTIKRSAKMEDSPHKWGVPGGYIDWNENGWESISRELYEETGFNVLKYKNNLIFDNDQQPWFVDSTPSHNKRQTISLFYILIYDFSKKFPVEIEFFENEEVERIKWMEISEIFKGEKKWAFEHDSRIEGAIHKFHKYLI